MNQTSYSAIINDQTGRMLWELGNVIDCCADRRMPAGFWEREFCAMPVWRHVYHTLRSLDRWLINPRVYTPPQALDAFPNDLDTPCEGVVTVEEMLVYRQSVFAKVLDYVSTLSESDLLECPPECEYTRFTLILAQFRHLHSHMGMLMGFIIAETGLWPYVAGLERELPVSDGAMFF